MARYINGIVDLNLQEGCHVTPEQAMYGFCCSISQRLTVQKTPSSSKAFEDGCITWS
jgi:hypothetical protein